MQRTCSWWSCDDTFSVYQTSFAKAGRSQVAQEYPLRCVPQQALYACYNIDHCSDVVHGGPVPAKVLVIVTSEPAKSREGDNV